jgi:hypothetical protein
MITHATGDGEPLSVAVTAAVEYVRSFMPKGGTAKPSRRRRKP